MERKLLFREEPVTSDHSINTSVSRVVFNIVSGQGEQLYDGSYYIKLSDLDRSNYMGDVAYEAQGYEVMNLFGMNTPDYKLGAHKGRIALALTPVIGNPLHRETEIPSFEQQVDDILKQNFKMWSDSFTLMRSQPEIFQRFRRSCPVAEAIGAAEKISIYSRQLGIISDERLPKNYTKLVDKVAERLKVQASAIARNDQVHFFQHGDEILSNFIFDPSINNVAVIDPSPRISTRMERALNKMLGGSMIFNFDINSDGKPVDQQRFSVLVSAIKRYNELIDDYYREVSPDQESSLKEILFINLSRIYFGIYNKENAGHIDLANKSKYLTMASDMYELFS